MLVCTSDDKRKVVGIVQGSQGGIQNIFFLNLIEV